MIYVVFIIIGAIILTVVESGKNSSLKDKVLTENGYKKLEVDVLEFEGMKAESPVTIVLEGDCLHILTEGIGKIIDFSEYISMDVQPATEAIGSKDFSASKALAGIVLLGGIGIVGGMIGNKGYSPQVLTLSYIGENGDTKKATFIQKLSNDKIQLRSYGNVLKVVASGIQSEINQKVK